MGFVDNCDKCGRWTNADGPGVSWSQTWYEDGYGGCLRDPRYRCSPCTDLHGIGRTNCALGYGGNGRNPATLQDASVKAEGAIDPAVRASSILTPKHLSETGEGG